jgi:hypothetical protein
MAFAIRRNYPYTGALTLCKIRTGSFAAREMVVSESEFCTAVIAYLDKLTPADRVKLRRSVPVDTEPQITLPGAERKAFKVRKAATAAT